MAKDMTGYALDSDGFPTEVRTSKTYGTQSYHYHGVKGGAPYWHWSADVHMGHGDKALRASIVAGRLIPATPRNAAGKAIQSLTKGALDESVIQQAQAVALSFEAAGYSKV